MICRAEHGGILTFEASTGKTAYFSDRELDIFGNWIVTGNRNSFIDRLLESGTILPIEDKEKEDVLSQISSINTVKTPLRSFSAPESIHIDLTTKCNVNCPQCYKNRNENFELSHDFLMDIINQAHRYRVFQIAFGGGEPLLYPYLLEAVKEVTGYKMACSVTTNGILFNRTFLDELRMAGINHIQISLNGSNEIVNSKSRESFHGAIDALKLLSNSDVSHGVNWVARKDNINDFDNLVNMAKNLSVNNINILRYKPSLTENYSEISLTKEETANLVAKIKRVKDVNIKIDSAYSNIICFIYNDKVSPAFSGCGAGRRFFTISADESFKGCSHTQEKEYYRDVKDFWLNSSILNQFRVVEDYLEGPCHECIFLFKCRGCRAICEYNNGHFFSRENDCFAFMRR